MKQYGETKKCSNVTYIRRVQILSFQIRCNFFNPVGLHTARAIHKYPSDIVVESGLGERIRDHLRSLQASEERPRSGPRITDGEYETLHMNYTAKTECSACPLI